jgi:integral membrane protein
VTPKRFFTFFAIAETVTWTLLLIGMFLKYVTHTTEVGVRIGGGIHGFIFICFVIAVIGVGTSQQWSKRRIATGLASAIIPYATIPFERSVEKTGSLEGDWGLGRNGRTPQTWFEKLTSWCIRSPWLAIGLGIIFVVLVFSGLLLAGPPGEWGK